MSERSKHILSGLTHREPLIDETDFERFVETVKPLLRASRDVLWVMAGRTDSNLPKIKKVLRKAGFKYDCFFLCYNTKQMQQYGYWKRQRGIANSKNVEMLFLAYLGTMPRHLPRKRQYLDPGSPLFNQLMRNVPVLAPRHQALVSRAVRDTSLNSMIGVASVEDENEKEKKQQDDEIDERAPLNQQSGPKPEDIAVLAAQVKKRKLYRQHTGTDVPWFPHDNDFDVLKELCWEAGNPRWVFFGTPAGGAGVHGCLEAGCSVVALCYDEHHRSTLQKFFLQRAVEAMVTGTTVVFKDMKLQARAVEFKLSNAAKKAASANDEDDDETDPKNATKEGKQKENGKLAKADAPKIQKKKETPKAGPQKKTGTLKKDAASESDESESDPADDSVAEEPAAKKSKNK